jgi:diacylglycerol O-acyltransferase / wax synthase
MVHDPLGGEDAAWLHMEDATNPMVVNGLLELATPLAPARLCGLLADRLSSRPRFRSRVIEPVSHMGTPRWEVDPEFSVERQVEHVDLPTSDDAALRAFVDGAISSLLDRSLPLWRVYVIDRPGKGSAVLFRIHHAIADGFALLGVLLSLCDGAEAAPGVALPPPRKVSPVQSVAELALAAGRVVLLPSDPKTRFKGALGPAKRVAWSERLLLDDVKRIARAEGATVNDVLVATVAGALRRYLLQNGADVDGLELRAMVPVNLRGAGELALGNRFGLVVLGLPIGVADPVARLAAVKRRMDRLKSTPEATVTMGILRAMGHAPRRVEGLGVAFFATKASLVLTNVPGPRAPLSIAGARITRLMFWVPQSGRMGLGVSIFSYAGEVTLGVMADAGIVPDPDALVADLHVELASLAANVRADVAARATP